MADSPEGWLSLQHHVTEHHVHTPDGSPSTVSALWIISTVQWECLAFGNSWLRRTGLSGLCLMSSWPLIGHSNECLCSSVSLQEEKYIAIDSNGCQKSFMGWNKSLWNNSLGIVFTPHCYLSQLLEPKSSNWGNVLRSGGGKNNKQTTWLRLPLTVTQPKTHFALSLNVFLKKLTFSKSPWWN